MSTLTSHRFAVPDIPSLNEVRLDIWRRLANSFAHLAREMAKRRRQRRAIAELEQLDDRILKDIGISRSEIPYLVQHGR